MRFLYFENILNYPMPNTVISVKFVDRYHFLWLEEKSYFSCVCKFEDPLLSTVSTCIYVVTNIRLILNFVVWYYQQNNYHTTNIRFGFMVFNATFNNISAILWQSVLLVEETGLFGENHQPATSDWQTLSHNVVSSTPLHGLEFNLWTYCEGENQFIDNSKKCCFYWLIDLIFDV